MDRAREGSRMSWFQKLLPPKIKREDAQRTKAVPEGLWSKCPSCEAVLYNTDLEKNLNVCPKCGHHHRIGARARLDAVPRPRGPLRDRPRGAAGRSAQVQGQPQVPRAADGGREGDRRDRRAGGDAGRGEERAAGRRRFEFDFMGGSMGSVVGERFVRGVQAARRAACPSSASPPPAARACRKACSR